MYNHVSYTLAQQHIHELQDAAERSRRAGSIPQNRPTFARRLMQIARWQPRPRPASAGVGLSPNA